MGSSAGPAQWPDASRLVEALVIRLCDLHPNKKVIQTGAGRVPRWSLILGDYGNIRSFVVSNHHLMEETSLQLFELNNSTLTQW